MSGAVSLPGFEEFTDGLTSLTDVDSVWQHTANLAYNFGFSSCSLTIAGRRATGLESTCLKSDLSEEFQRAYRFQGLVDCDPFLQFSCTNLTAKRIDSSNLSSIAGASTEHEMFLDHAATAGAASGYGISVRLAGDEVFGGWLFTSPERNDDFDRLISDHGRDAHLAAVLAYERMVHLGLRESSVPAGLSRRERECLLWLCAGLRVSTIADKLSISESAVNLYVSNAKRKLGQEPGSRRSPGRSSTARSAFKARRPSSAAKAYIRACGTQPDTRTTLRLRQKRHSIRSIAKTS